MHHRPFGLVLAGDGAQGMAHVGAPKALNHLGYYPNAVAGVSVGALIAAACDWYRDLVAMDVSGIPVVPDLRAWEMPDRIRNFAIAGRELRAPTFGWGAGEHTVDRGRSVIKELTFGKDLESGRARTHITATDILTGERVVRTRGNAVDAIHASSAPAGLLPPFTDGPHLPTDGGHSDSSPVDLVREVGVDCVITIDPGQRQVDQPPKNGPDVFLRSIEVTHNAFSRSRGKEADLVLAPEYGISIGVLDFAHKRRCIAAGVAAVRRAAPRLEALLTPVCETLQVVSAQ